MNTTTTSIISVARYRYKEEVHIKNHRHNFYHLLYVTNGHGVLRIDEDEFNPVEADLYMVRPGAQHEILSDNRFPLSTLEVKFITNHPLLNAGLEFLPLPFRNDAIHIQSTLNRLVDEAINKNRYYKEIITFHFQEFLFQMLRQNESKPMKEEPWEKDVRLREEYGSRDLANEILKHIHKHYMEHITLKSLAANFNISLTYICRVFTNKYQISPIQYANSLKLEKVKELLSGTDLSITEISDLVGFNSIHYLSRYFTAKEKITPQEFRRRSINAIHVGVEEKFKIVNYMVDLS